MLKRDSARAPSWAAAVMISGAEATFFTGLGDHFRPSAPWSGHGQVSGSPGRGGRLEAQDWEEGSEFTSWRLGSDLWSTVCVICGNVTDDSPPG